MDLLGAYITAADMTIIMLVLNIVIFALLLRVYLKLRRQG
jgi:hypothetical protein